MNIVAWITGLVLIAGFGSSGAFKIMDNPQMQEVREHFGIAKQQFQGLGALEVLGALGVLIGLLVNNGNALEALGPLAGAGLAAVGFGAFVKHQQKKDDIQMAAPALVLGIVAVVYIIAIFAR